MLTAKNGTTQFYSMRVATDDFRGGETTTVWVNVRIGADRVGKMKFTKGSHVLVTGTLSASTYQTKAGETAISLDVMADIEANIDYPEAAFNPSGKNYANIRVFRKRI